MKTFYYFPAIVIASVCFMVSCTQSKIYDNAIADYILRSEGGKADFSVKIHSVKDLGRIIIIDGNRKLTDQTKNEKSELVQLEEQLIILQDELFNLQVDNIVSGREIVETYITKISNLQQQIEYLKTEALATDSIDTKARKEVTAVVAKCKYSINYTGLDKEEIMTKSFVVSEDGKTCYGLVDDFMEVSK